jgi:protein-tyrosine phosphatase
VLPRFTSSRNGAPNLTCFLKQLLDALLKWNLVDIHSHVLFGMDDGAETLEDSIALVKMAADAGTTDLVGTPHASPAYRFDPARVMERRRLVESAAGGALRLYTGCDFHLSYDNIEDALKNPTKYTINQNRYLLVEFSDLLIFKNTGEIFARLTDAGMIPVITHPERNRLLRKRLDELAQWCEAGAYIQVTGQSLLGGFGKSAHEFSRTLLDQRLVHFIASDGHDAVRRPPTMNTAFAWLDEHYGRPMAEALCVTNPRAALLGDAITLPEAASVPSSRKWYEIWR